MSGRLPGRPEFILVLACIDANLFSHYEFSQVVIAILPCYIRACRPFYTPGVLDVPGKDTLGVSAARVTDPAWQDRQT